MTDTELSIEHHDYMLRKSYWILRDWIEKCPKIKGDYDFTVMRTRDHLGELAKDIKRSWDQKVSSVPSFKPSQYGDLMTVEEWLDCVKTGGFIDYDGSGSLATKDGVCDIRIQPSDITALKLELPTWCTHIVWYNR